MPDKSAYRQIIKATSIFGGVQVFQIIVAIIRSKFIAVLLGPAGIGIIGLLNAAISVIAAFTSLGLGTSAVKHIATASGTGDKKKIATVVTVLKRMVWFTGLFGAISTIILSPWLSQLSFGNKNYTLAFIWISVTLLLNQISTGQSVVLQGMRQINYMARSSLAGAVIGLAVSLPIYYAWGIDGIVPAIIATSIISLSVTWYFSKKVTLDKVVVALRTTIAEGKGMLTMGFMLTISNLYVLAKNYGIQAYIGDTGGLEEVGLYAAGFAITTSYVGLVFTAMSTDYFPRLSAIAHNNIDARSLINQQAEIAILILGPIISIFIVFSGWIVVLLYSSTFIPITQMIQWAMLGMFFKATSWSMGFIFLAKGESKLFLANELFGGTVTLGCHVSGYYFGGLTGMGIGFLLGYFYHMFQVFFVSKHYYEFSFERKFLRILLLQLFLAVLSFVTILFISAPLSYFAGLIVIIISTIYSFNELDKRIDVSAILNSMVNRNE